MNAFLKMTDICKSFGRVRASDHVTFEARTGEIHALLGENGAGKSTLMNILYGLIQPDSGDICIQDQKVTIRSPQDSIGLGIGMVHQHFMLIPAFTVTENVMLGLRSSRRPFLDTHQVSARLRQLADQYGLYVDPEAYVWQLSVGTQQRVEVLKALYRGAQILVLDEPTAILTSQETHEFFATLQSMAAKGYIIIFITHKMEEVMAISHRCTVLRDGKVVGTVNTQETSKTELARMMLGREVMFRLNKPPATPGRVILSVQNLSVTGERGRSAARNLSFEVRAGEILGIAGIDGNGQSELVEAITGLRRPSTGRILIGDRDVTSASTWEILQQQVACVPEDRMTMGLVPAFDVQENLILETHAETPFSHSRPDTRWAAGWFLNMRAISEHARRVIAEYNIKASGPDASVRFLSGGNLQKLVLARAIGRLPRLLIAVQPTRGLDVGATEFIWNRLLAERAAGRAILLISADLDEILQLSDRLMVMFEGTINGQVSVTQPASVNMTDIGLLMSGVRPAVSE